MPASAGTDCPRNVLAQFPMDQGQNERLTAPVQINGKSETLLVDTASVFSTLTTEAVKALSLPERPLPPRRIVVSGGHMTLHEEGGVFMQQAAEIKELEIGSLKKTDFYTLELDQSRAPWAGRLGLDVLRKLDVEIDSGAHTVFLYEPRDCSDQMVLWTKAPYSRVPLISTRGEQLSFEVTIDGHSLQALLDTASPGSWMNGHTIANTFGLPDPIPKDVHDVGRHLSLGGVTIENPVIYISASTPPTGIDILIGRSIIDLLHLYIAFPQKTLYVTRADAR